HVTLQRGEDPRLAPSQHITRLHHVQILVVGIQVREIQAETAPDLRHHDHMGKCLQLMVTLVPPLGLLGEPGHCLEDRLVVPHYAERFRHLPEFLHAETLNRHARDSVDFGGGDSCPVIHRFLLPGGFSSPAFTHEDTSHDPSVTPTCRACYVPARTVHSTPALPHLQLPCLRVRSPGFAPTSQPVQPFPTGNDHGSPVARRYLS